MSDTSQGTVNLSNSLKAYNMTLAYFDNIQYGVFKDLDVLVDPASHELWVSLPAVERVFGLKYSAGHDKIASKSFKDFSEYLNVPIQTKILDCMDVRGYPNRLTCVLMETFEVFAAWLYRKNKNASVFNLLSDQSKLYASSYDHFLEVSKSTRSFKPSQRSEKMIQEKLANLLNGETEVETPVGRVDILTPTEIIEVKIARQWKSALGQVLAYAHYYPSHQKRIHLYGTMHSDSKFNAKMICANHGVKVSWE